MSKETLRASECVCGQRIQFVEQHWPHCPANPLNLTGTAKRVIESKFSKAELATIAKQGPMNDQPVRKVKNTGKRKPSNSKVKRV